MAEQSMVGVAYVDLHPFTTFDDNKQYYDDKASTTYAANVWNAVIKNFEEHSIFGREGDFRRRRLGRPDVATAGGLPDKKTMILKKPSGATRARQAETVDQAKTFYADYDFRCLQAALAASS